MNMSTLRIRLIRTGLYAAVSLLLFAGAAHAQVESGTIAGLVSDSSGAVIPGAHVVVTSMATQTQRSTDTNDSGGFSVPFLTPGEYNLEASKNGFQTFLQRGLALNVAQTLRIDITLQTGSIKEQVVVTGEAPVLQTSDATLGQVIGSQEVQNLPLNGRNFLDLASLSAGTAHHEPGARNGDAGGFSSNGGRTYDNNIMLDGVDNNNLSPDLRNGTDYMVKTPPDAIAEFKVETNGYGPEFGRGGGAAVNVAIKSGTNQFHGDVWEFLRNNKLDARNFFDYASGGAPPLRRNQFGGTAGGPIVRDHTFFFADYEGNRRREAQTFLSTVPTAAEKTGDFSDGFLGTIIDPTTGQPYVNQQITPGQIDPVALKVAALIADPNIPGTNQFAYNPIRMIDTDQFDVRVDHQLNKFTPIFARLSYSNENQNNPGTLPGLAVGATNGATTGNTTKITTLGLALGVTHVFSPTIVNDFRFGYGRLNLNQVALLTDVNVAQALGIPGIPFIPGINGGLPNFNFSDVRQLGAGGCEPTVEITNVFTYRDVLNVVRGKHSMNMGFEGRPSEFTILQPCGSRGEFSYAGVFTGSGFADFLIGMPVEANLASFHNIDYKRGNFGAFWGDTWRGTPKLTVNAGIRWEYHTPVYEKYNAQASLNLNSNVYEMSKAATLPAGFLFPTSVVGKYLNNPQHNDWAPRLGVTYQLNPKTVLRGSYGLYWQAEEIGTYSNPSPGFNPPFYIDAVFYAVSATQVNPIVNVLGNGFPANAITSGFDPTSVFYTRLQKDLSDAYVQSWNLTVQRELGLNTSLELAYMGNKGTHLINGAVGNQATPSPDPTSDIQPRRPIPALNSETFDILSNAYSNYNGLGITLRHRQSHGLSFNFAYTWSHALDLASSSNLGSANNGFFRDYNHQFWEYGNADFDTRHRVTAYYAYELPFGRGRAYASNVSPALNAVIGGWITEGIWSFNSGNWFTPITSVDYSNSGGNSPRPDMICNPNSGAPHTTTTWFNTSCFVTPAEGSFGNAGRNVILGPRFFTNDLSLRKEWRVRESMRIEFRSEFFNAFNHPTFPQIDDLVQDDPAFGLIQTANKPRQIQFGVKFYW